MAEKTQRKFTFKVRAGRHLGSKHDGPEEAGKVYTQGQLVHTDTDLIACHGSGKFELIRGPADAAKERVLNPRPTNRPTPAEPVEETEDEEDTDETNNDPAGEELETATADELRAMSIKELKDYAAERGIDLTGITGKENLIRAIQSSE